MKDRKFKSEKQVNFFDFRGADLHGATFTFANSKTAKTQGDNISTGSVNSKDGFICVGNKKLNNNTFYEGQTARAETSLFITFVQYLEEITTNTANFVQTKWDDNNNEVIRKVGTLTFLIWENRQLIVDSINLLLKKP